MNRNKETNGWHQVTLSHWKMSSTPLPFLPISVLASELKAYCELKFSVKTRACKIINSFFCGHVTALKVKVKRMHLQSSMGVNIGRSGRVLLA